MGHLYVPSLLEEAEVEGQRPDSWFPKTKHGGGLFGELKTLSVWAAVIVCNYMCGPTLRKLYT